MSMSVLQIISAITLGLAALVLTLIAAGIILMMYRGTLDSRTFNFLYEASGDGRAGKPSVSRLQMVIWNFVVAFAFLYILGKDGITSAIPDLLQPEILILLGISNGTYILGKKTRQGSARSDSTDAPAAADSRAGQPVAGGEDPNLGPGPQGTP